MGSLTITHYVRFTGWNYASWFFFFLSFCSATELSRNPSFSYSKQPLFRGRQWTVSRMTARCTRIEKRRSVSPCNANCDILWNCPRTDILIILALGLRTMIRASNSNLIDLLSSSKTNSRKNSNERERRLRERSKLCQLSRMWFMLQRVYIYIYR